MYVNVFKLAVRVRDTNLAWGTKLSSAGPAPNKLFFAFPLVKLKTS